MKEWYFNTVIDTSDVKKSYLHYNVFYKTVIYTVKESYSFTQFFKLATSMSLVHPFTTVWSST